MNETDIPSGFPPESYGVAALSERSLADPLPEDNFIIVALKTSTIVFSGDLKGAKDRAKIIRACDGECEIFKLTKY